MEDYNIIFFVSETGKLKLDNNPNICDKLSMSLGGSQTYF